MTGALNGKVITLTAKPKESEGALPVRRANGRPYVSATSLLKECGFDGSKAYDVEAKPVNSHGFSFTLK